MGIRKFRPITPGQRHKAIGTFDDVTTSVPEKSLVYGKRSTGGRNNQGRMTVRYRGGGHKRKLRMIDFKREKDGIPAVVKTIEYDPNRSARIALVFYADGEKRYIVAPNGLQVGTTIMSGANAAPDLGNTLPLQNIPVGTVIHNIELRPGQGAKMVRSAGNFAQLTSREGDYCVINCLQVKFVRCSQLAALPLVVSAILTMHWNLRVRRVAVAGSVAVLTTVVLS